MQKVIDFIKINKFSYRGKSKYIDSHSLQNLPPITFYYLCSMLSAFSLGELASIIYCIGV